MPTKEPGRPNKPNKRTGGPNKMPRSLGAVFEAIRVRKGWSQAEMMKALIEVESPFLLPAPRRNRNDAAHTASGTASKPNQEKNPAGSISNYENAKDNAPFSVQHRYGRVAETSSGVLHITSLLFANLRNAAEQTDQQQALILENLAVAEGLIELAEHAKRLSQLSNISAWTKLTERTNHVELHQSHLNAINELLDSYRSGYKRVLKRD